MTKRLPLIVGLIVAMCWPLVLAAFIPVQNLHDIRQDAIVLCAEWLSVAVIYAIVVGWERRPFWSTVGWVAPKTADWLLVALFAVIAAVGCVVLWRLHPTAAMRGTIFGQIYGVPLGIRIALVFTAGICEETLFRGYAIERLKVLTGNVWIGALIAAVLFTLGHIPRYGLGGGLIGVMADAVLLSLIYIRRRNIVPCVALHWLIDGFPLLIVPAFVTIK
ncbi:MAG: CPBP family intramembrane metalloprotease [Candidatus Eremiobacteraeota bacterium]|nr:CPBP family intramembrane metalloprotease [Candidatus Eremiobacteraeota bacterium]MBV9263910.1 CPBP family intramembrane metalloprotease [Candidatus Eremiobacteraeota bacterium]